jgi:uncharacterized protein (TIGR02217 family)
MSNAVFPSNLPGLSWGVRKAPEFNTKVQRSTNGRELRAAFYSYPLYNFSLKFEVLREAGAINELQTLMGFFLQRQGQFDSFLYTDPSDNTVTDQSFGNGNGIQTQFQLVRPMGGFSEPVQNVNMMTNVKVNGTVVSNYTVSGTGLLTFASPPNGPLTWSGTYYYRVRFTMDVGDFEQFMYRLWELKKCEFRGAVGNKV